ncbi:MAG: hypothetical protein HZA93_18545 [Verrucomicrobia bacterium]|nr:hypothetical protein [Verrucomicrobiota bacterium]
MEFLTIHELSRQFDIPSRVIRYRLRQLVQAGKFIENTDYRRDDFIDDQHFVWQVNALSFMRETGLKLAPKPRVPQSAVTKEQPVVNGAGNQATTLVDESVTKLPPVVHQPPGADTKTTPPPEPKPTALGLEREMIDLLKDQVRVKDGQIRELTEQNHSLSDTNLKLMGQTVKQADEIQNLLRLTGGKTDLSEFVTKDGHQPHESVNHVDNKTTLPDNNTGNQNDAVGSHAGNHSATDRPIPRAA